MNYDKAFYKLALEYKRLFMETEGDKFLFQIGKFASVRSCLVEVYYALIRAGKCEPIEKLSDKEKTDLWQEARRITENRSRSYMVEVCKALHGFGNFIQLEEEIEF